MKSMVVNAGTAAKNWLFGSTKHGKYSKTPMKLGIATVLIVLVGQLILSIWDKKED